MEYKVVKKRKADTNNPVKVHKGDFVKCIKKSNSNGDWAGWIFCDTGNNSGWIPRQIIDGEGMILEDYNAIEFDIEVNEIIVMDKVLNGWIWGFKKGNPEIKAWVPLNHIEKLI